MESNTLSTYLLDNNLVQNAKRALSKNHLSDHPLNRQDFLAALQFLDCLVLFDRLALNSTIYSPYAEEVSIFLKSIQSEFLNDKHQVFLFNNFKNVLDDSKRLAIEDSLFVFNKLMEKKKPIDTFYEHVSPTHRKGIVEAWTSLTKDNLDKKKEQGLEFINQQKEFYGRNYFSAIYRDERNFDMLLRLKHQAKKDYLKIISTMFTYFSFHLNRKLAYFLDNWGYAPAFLRDKLVKKLEHEVHTCMSQDYKDIMKTKLKELVNDLVGTSNLNPEHQQQILGRIWFEEQLPFFGYIVYRTAKNASIESILENAGKVRADAAIYRKWLHKSNWKKSGPKSRILELEKAENYLREKYGLKRKDQIASTSSVLSFLDNISIGAPLEMLVKLLNRYRLKKKPHITFLSNTLDRFLSVEN